MPRQVILLRVFLASPGDLAEERQELRRMVSDLNTALALPKGLYVNLIGWEDLPATKGDPQAVINPKVRESDLVLVIFNQRLGSPTSTAPSGTVEEFLLAMQQCDQGSLDDIKVYFAEKLAPNGYSAAEIEQAEKIRRFREDLERQRSVFSRSYRDIHDLVRKIRDDLESWLIPWMEIARIALTRSGGGRSSDAGGDWEAGASIARERAEARLRAWPAAGEERERQMTFLEETAYCFYLTAAPEDVAKLRLWTQWSAAAPIFAKPPITIPFDGMPERAWPLIRRNGKGRKACLTAAFPSELVVVGEDGFSFARPELFWYFIAAKLFRAIRRGDWTPMNEKEFVNEIHQFLALRVAGDPEAVRVLIDWLSPSEHPETVRNFAAFALGMSRSRAAVDPLIRSILEDRGQNVATYAALALRMIKDRQAVSRLLQLRDCVPDGPTRRYLDDAVYHAVLLQDRR